MMRGGGLVGGGKRCSGGCSGIEADRFGPGGAGGLGLSDLFEAGFQLRLAGLRLLDAPGLDRIAGNGSEIVGGLAAELVGRHGC